MKSKCKYYEKSCGECKDTDPFTTQNYCPAAVKLFIANENIICPSCKKGHMKLNKEHSFECPLCLNTLNYDKIL